MKRSAMASCCKLATWPKWHSCLRSLLHIVSDARSCDTSSRPYSEQHQQHIHEQKPLPDCLQWWVWNRTTAAALQFCMHLLRLHDGAACVPAACALVSYTLYVLLELLRLQARKNRLLSKLKQTKQHAKPVIAGCIKQASPAAVTYVLMLI